MGKGTKSRFKHRIERLPLDVTPLGGIIVKCYIFRTFQPFFFIISSRFYEIKKKPSISLW